MRHGIVGVALGANGANRGHCTCPCAGESTLKGLSLLGDSDNPWGTLVTYDLWLQHAGIWFTNQVAFLLQVLHLV